MSVPSEALPPTSVPGERPDTREAVPPTRPPHGTVPEAEANGPPTFDPSGGTKSKFPDELFMPPSLAPN
jgi:hypothetical protein